MDNYEEIRINSKAVDCVDGINDSLNTETSSFLNSKRFKRSTSDYVFGAEIFKTKIMESECENVIATIDKTEKSTNELPDHANNEKEIPNCVDKTARNIECLKNEYNEIIDIDENITTDSYPTSEDENEEGPHLKNNLRPDLVLNSHEDSEDDSSSDSNFSDLSGLSEMSGRGWKPNARPINWVQKQIHSGANPRELLSQILPSNQIAPEVNDMMLWRILASMLQEPPRRQKLRYINTFEDVIQLVLQSQNIIVLTGAGVSVSCGIPDFRSSDGIYSRLAKDFPDLPDPQAMFDISYFSRDPRPFYKFAREIYPGQFKPSPCHRFIKLLEEKQKLLRNYTQNIDTLEQVAGIKNVIECHGSFSTASCTKCKFKCAADDIRADIFAQRIPVCPCCQPNVQQSVDASEPVSESELRQLVQNGIMKPDIVFFGEGLPEEFHTVMASDKDKCDLLIVVGSSLKVRPVALIPSSIPPQVPQILINREQLHHLEFDVELLGDSDVIINQLCHHLGNDWNEICFNDKVLAEAKDLLPMDEEYTGENEEYVQQQLQDADTQSVKSNASTDFASRSAGAYSDSGFESSTSLGGSSIRKPVDNSEAEREIEKIKTTILGLNDTLTKTKAVDLLTPDLLDVPADAGNTNNASFQPFAERYVQEKSAERHLSIDSSKDSGIQCDSSNSTLVANSPSTNLLQPPLANFGDSGGTNCADSNIILETAASTSLNCEQNPNVKFSNSSTVCSTSTTECESKRLQHKRQSLAERLREGTFYCHNIASYIFPGAQVSWSSDSEEDDDEDDENEYDDDDIGGDTNATTLSPLLTPSVEAEMVSEITTTTTTATTTSRSHSFLPYVKRRCVDNVEDETVSSLENHRIPSNQESMLPANTNSLISVDNRPPIKRRRNSSDNLTDTTAEAVMASITTTTINTDMTSSSNNLTISNAEATTEILLQGL